MKKLLVVGANSYIATSFEQYARERFTIRMVGSRDNIWRQEDFRGYDALLCCVGIAHLPKGIADEKEYDEINCGLCLQIAKKAKAAGVGQFLFLSSASVYGQNKVDVTKKTTPAPNTPYGQSKLRAEMGLMELFDEDFPICILRPPMVYGPGCKGNFPQLVALAKKTPLFPHYQNKRSMLYIDNLCEFLAQAVERSYEGLYLPQNKRYVSTFRMVQGISRATGRKIRFTKVFNAPLRLAVGYIPLLQKVFGDFTYRHSVSEGEYNVVSFEESIERSVRADG